MSKKDKRKALSVQLKFLVVDDDAGARSTICDYLRSFGYEKILEAKDGNEALQLIHDNTIDFIISDWEMPGPSGLDLLRSIKADPAFRRVPFVMVTSPGSLERVKIEEAGTSNVDGYIIKPFRADVLQEKIETALASIFRANCQGALVVDDDPVVRSTIVDYLKTMNYGPIHEADNGVDGLQVLRDFISEIAFVVSDWEMPGLAGIDLLKKIRQDPLLEHVPFIMCTSQTSIEVLKLQQAIQADVDNYLLKPFRVDDLKAKIIKVVEEARRRSAVARDFMRGQELLAKGRWQDAMNIFSQVVAVDPRNAPAYLGLAHAQRRLAPEKAIPKATQFIRQAMSINPGYDQAHIDLALTFESAMSLEKAISALKDAIKLCPGSSKIFFELGRLQLRRGLREDAKVAFERAIKLDPKLTEAKDLLASIKE